MRSEDEPVLRYVPYFGDDDTTGVDVSAYDMVPGELAADVSGEAEEVTIWHMIQKHCGGSLGTAAITAGTEGDDDDDDDDDDSDDNDDDNNNTGDNGSSSAGEKGSGDKGSRAGKVGEVIDIISDNSDDSSSFYESPKPKLSALKKKREGRSPGSRVGGNKENRGNRGNTKKPVIFKDVLFASPSSANDMSVDSQQGVTPSKKRTAQPELALAVLSALEKALNMSCSQILKTYERVDGGVKERSRPASKVYEVYRSQRAAWIGNPSLVPLQGIEPPFFTREEETLRKLEEDAAVEGKASKGGAPAYTANSVRKQQAVITVSGIKNMAPYENLVESYRELFCRRCFLYDCRNHGVDQPPPGETHKCEPHV
jgi:hypothetical protein